MLTKSTLLHLRLLFSFFLLPTYLLALNCAEKPVLKKLPVLSLLCVLRSGSDNFSCILLGDTGYSTAGYVQYASSLGRGCLLLFLIAAYPMTKIYQHKSDGERGGLSFSMILVIRGTFIFCALLSIASRKFLATNGGKLPIRNINFFVCHTPTCSVISNR